LQDKPPIPVSTDTKNKLRVFQFGGKPEQEKITGPVISLLSDDEKENENVASGKIAEVIQEAAKKASQEQLLELPKNVPSTPAGRLALPDLIGMGDVQKAVQNISPDERIEWDHDKDMVYGQTSFKGIRRTRKRARSSSPTTSSPAQVSAHFTSKVESPQIDPGSELWGRYSLNAPNAPTPQGPSIPALAHLMYTSSPQPSKEGVTPRSGGFRRANSCGNQFPKRRRVGGSEGDDVFTESAAIGPSKLSVLIERVQEGLSQPRKPPNQIWPTNVPLKRQPSDLEDDSPTYQSRRGEVKPPPTKPIAIEAPPMGNEYEKSNSSEQNSLDSNSSDYGEFDDGDLDASILEVFETKPAQHNSIASNDLPSKLSKEPAAKPPQPPIRTNPPPPVAQASKPPISRTAQARDDEFDDSDDDVFTAGLENILSQINQRPLTEYKVLPGRGERSGVSESPEAARASKAESEDEFGDDGLDDLDFEAAEATATQSIQQTANSLLPVRTRFP
jgi:DNA replication ATP-dependent helicase Dna2